MKKGCLFATNLISPENYNLKLGKRSSSFALICSEKRRKILKVFCFLFFVGLFNLCSLLMLHVKSSPQAMVGLFLCFIVLC